MSGDFEARGEKEAEKMAGKKEISGRASVQATVSTCALFPFIFLEIKEIAQPHSSRPGFVGNSCRILKKGSCMMLLARVPALEHILRTKDVLKSTGYTSVNMSKASTQSLNTKGEPSGHTWLLASVDVRFAEILYSWYSDWLSTPPMFILKRGSSGGVRSMASSRV